MVSNLLSIICSHDKCESGYKENGNVCYGCYFSFSLFFVFSMILKLCHNSAIYFKLLGLFAEAEQPLTRK